MLRQVKAWAAGLCGPILLQALAVAQQQIIQLVKMLWVDFWESEKVCYFGNQRGGFK
jgi:hypothetical protein